MNTLDIDLELFEEVEATVKNLVENNKEKFENPLINISYEEEKSLLKSIKGKLKYKKYTWLSQDIVRAVAKVDKLGESVLKMIIPHLPIR